VNRGGVPRADDTCGRQHTTVGRDRVVEAMLEARRQGCRTPGRPFKGAPGQIVCAQIISLQTVSSQSNFS